MENTDQSPSNSTLPEKLTDKDITIIILLSIGLPIIAILLLIILLSQRNCKNKCKECCRNCNKNCCNKCCKNKVKTEKLPVIDLEEGKKNNKKIIQPPLPQVSQKNVPKQNMTVNREKRRSLLLKKNKSVSKDSDETIEQKTKDELN